MSPWRWIDSGGWRLFFRIFTAEKRTVLAVIGISIANPLDSKKTACVQRARYPGHFNHALVL